jgi:exodeoxyribonuclease VII large subunit
MATQSIPQFSILSVSQINSMVKELVENGLGSFWIKGEISNFTAHSSGHWYLTLKDDSAQISAVVWSNNNTSVLHLPKNGQSILAFGKLKVFTRGGRYQFDISAIELVDQKGNLFLQYEARKKKYDALGYFKLEGKKPLPVFPRNIAIVSSPTGAALQDALKVLNLRAPQIRVFLIPVAVQGDSAAEGIAAAIDYIQTLPALDLILLIRGGGSLEDLWAFNEEAVVEAIYRSQIPVVTGIGHQTDYTLSDFVADVRAATPSHAAEMISADNATTLQHLQTLWMQAERAIRRLSRQRTQELLSQQKVLAANQPLSKMREFSQVLDLLSEQLVKAFRYRVNHMANAIQTQENLLQSLNPNAILARGYAIVRAGNKVVPSGKNLQKNEAVQIRFRDCERQAMITDGK